MLQFVASANMLWTSNLDNSIGPEVTENVGNNKDNIDHKLFATFVMQECKGLSDGNGWTDFCNHVELFTGINNRFVYEYLNGVLV